jgi:hypothetical protein
MTDYALYIDDSGHPDDQAFVVAAGFIATEKEWLEFEPAWKMVLRNVGLSEPFHMTDFMAEKRSTKDRSSILRKLRQVIALHTRACFAGGIEIAGYKKVNDQYALQESLGAPYALAARILAIQMNKWRGRNLTQEDHLLLFAEEGTKHRGDMIEVFKRDQLPEPISIKKSLAAVQPADMLAWEMFQFLRGSKDSENRKRIQHLTKRQKQFGLVWYEKDLVKTCVKTDPPVMLRSQLSPNAQILFHSSPKKKRVRTIK